MYYTLTSTQTNFWDLVPYLIVAFIAVHVGYAFCWLQFYTIRDSAEADVRRQHTDEKYVPPDDVELRCSWEPNSRGILLYRQQFIPKLKSKKQSIKGVIGLCHGYCDHTNDMRADLAVKFCRCGYIVITLDVEGHGFSDGPPAYIPDLKQVADDLSSYFLEKLSEKEFANKPFFVFGESMGGATVFYLCTQCEIRSQIRGAIMIAPMVRVADEMKPPQFITDIFLVLARYFPYAPIAPIPDIVDKCFKRKDVLARARKGKLNYQKKPPLGSAVALLAATDHIAAHMNELTHPVLILHGEADEVTSPKDSVILYEKCLSKDKALKTYPGVWHDMLNGESEEQIAAIFNDIVSWIDERL